MFYHFGQGILTYIYGGDYVSTGKAKQLRWMKTQLDAKRIAKTEALGLGPDNKQQIELFYRVVSWHDTQGILYEAFPRHTEIIIKQLQFIGAKAVNTPGIREEGNISDDNEQLLSDKEATNYRALVARCNYLFRDRQDMAFAVKGLARAMAKPTRGYLQRLKRLARYLEGRP